MNRVFFTYNVGGKCFRFLDWSFIVFRASSRGETERIYGFNGTIDLSSVPILPYGLGACDRGFRDTLTRNSRMKVNKLSKHWLNSNSFIACTLLVGWWLFLVSKNRWLQITHVTSEQTNKQTNKFSFLTFILSNIQSEPHCQQVACEIAQAVRALAQL